MGLNDPIIIQFGRFAKNALVGDFGISYQHKRPVSEMLIERLPATLELSIVSAIFSLVVGIPWVFIQGYIDSVGLVEL